MADHNEEERRNWMLESHFLPSSESISAASLSSKSSEIGNMGTESNAEPNLSFNESSFLSDSSPVMIPMDPFLSSTDNFSNVNTLTDSPNTKNYELTKNNMFKDDLESDPMGSWSHPTDDNSNNEFASINIGTSRSLPGKSNALLQFNKNNWVESDFTVIDNSSSAAGSLNKNEVISRKLTPALKNSQSFSSLPSKIINSKKYKHEKSLSLAGNSYLNNNNTSLIFDSKNFESDNSMRSNSFHAVEDLDNSNQSIWTEKNAGRRRRKGPLLDNTINSVSTSNRLSTGTNISMMLSSSGGVDDIDNDVTENIKLHTFKQPYNHDINDDINGDEVDDEIFLNNPEFMTTGTISRNNTNNTDSRKWRPLAMFILAISVLCLIIVGFKLDPLILSIPPRTKQFSSSSILFNSVNITDDYTWISNIPMNEDAKFYLKQENDWADSKMNTSPLVSPKNNVYNELKTSISSIGSFKGACADYAAYGNDFWTQGNYFYWKEITTLKPLPVYKRRKLINVSLREADNLPLNSRVALRDSPLTDRVSVCGCPIGPEHLVLDYNTLMDNLNIVHRENEHTSLWGAEKLYSFLRDDELFLFEDEVNMIPLPNKANSNNNYNRKYLKTDLKRSDIFREGVFEIDPNNENLLAFSFDLFGSEKNILFVKDINKRLFSRPIFNTANSVKWISVADKDHLIFVSFDRLKQEYYVYIGIPTVALTDISFSEDSLIWKTGAELKYSDNYESVYSTKYNDWQSAVDLISTSDNKYVFINVHNSSSNELINVNKEVIESFTPTSTNLLKPLFKKDSSCVYKISHQANRFFVLVHSSKLNNSKGIQCINGCLFIANEDTILKEKGNLTIYDFFKIPSLVKAKKRDNDITSKNQKRDSEKEDKKTNDAGNKKDDKKDNKNIDNENNNEPDNKNDDKNEIKNDRKNSSILILPSIDDTYYESMFALKSHLAVWIRKNGSRELIIFDTKKLNEDLTKLQYIENFDYGFLSSSEYIIENEDKSIVGQKTLIKDFEGRLLRFKNIKDLQPVIADETEESLRAIRVYAVGLGPKVMLDKNPHILYNSECLVYSHSSFSLPPSGYSLDLVNMKSYMLFKEFLPDLNSLGTTGKRVIENHNSKTENGDIVIKSFNVPMIKTADSKSKMFKDRENDVFFNTLVRDLNTPIGSRFTDGESSIHLSLCYREGTVFPTAILLNVFSFDFKDPKYSAHNLPLISRGVVVANCYTRGSLYRGEEWKQSGINDYIFHPILDTEACIRHLVDMQLAVKGRILIKSVGMNSIITTNVGNDLAWVPGTGEGYISGIFLDMPLLDPILSRNTDISLKWISFQFGMNITDHNYKVLDEISPYNRINKSYYPSTFIVSGTYDINVPVGQSLKYVAKLRDKKTNSDHDKVLLFKSYDFGRLQTSLIPVKIKVSSEKLSFILSSLNIYA